MREPVLSYDIAMGGDAPAWHRLGEYALWTYHRAGPEPFAVWEMRDGGPRELPPKAHALYNIKPGVPHRIAPLFGFWRISAGDTDLLKAGDDDGAAYTIVINTAAPGYGIDRIAWFCLACGTPLHDAPYEAGRLGVASYWEHAAAEVRAFNANQVQRTCPGCQTVHPEAYDFGLRDLAAW